VDIVASPINYMHGRAPARYSKRPYLAEVIDGVVHHWVWATENIHASRSRRALNYATFATCAAVRATTLSSPDLIWASSPPISVGAVGAALGRRFRQPWIFEVRDLWPESAASLGWLDASGTAYRAVERIARRYASGADWVIVPTPGLVEPVQSHGARRVSVVPGAVVDHAPDPETRIRVRAELGLNDQECLFLYAGALGLANRMGMLLDAAQLLDRADPVRIVLAGDGSARAYVEARLRADGIPHVQFLGPVSKTRIAELLAASDVCLHLLQDAPVFSTALPSKILEYFSAHRPFITTARGLPERLARESGGGFAASVGQLVDQLRLWSKLPTGRRSELGEQSFAYGSTRYRISTAVDELETTLVAALENGERG
jgi:colanic acid biosynthesis glycosyl transferase WcaI